MLHNSGCIRRFNITVILNLKLELKAEAHMEKNRQAQAVLRQWREEDETDDPEEIARRQAEWEEFRKGMNEHHSSGRVIYP